MARSFHGRILRVDLSSGRIAVESRAPAQGLLHVVAAGPFLLFLLRGRWAWSGSPGLSSGVTLTSASPGQT